MPLSAVAEPNTLPPRVRINVTGRGSGVNGLLRLIRVDAYGGTTLVREPVRLTSGAGTGYDEEVPYGPPVTYRTVDLPQESSGAVTLISADMWAIHPLVRSASLRLPRWDDDRLHLGDRSFAQTSSPSVASEVQVLNRDLPIVQRVGRRRRRDSLLTLHTYTELEAVAVTALIEDDAPILLNVPPSLAGGRTPYQWVLFKDVDVEWVDEYPGDTRAVWTMPFGRVGVPAGMAAPSWSNGNVLETYATCADVEAAYPTCGDLESDLRSVP